jgi:hypothetical protein
MSEVADTMPGIAADFNRMLGEAMGQIFWRPAGVMFPLDQGDVLYSGPQNPTNDPQFRLDVAFAQPEFAEAQPVLPLLVQYGQAVEAILDSFAPLF